MQLSFVRTLLALLPALLILVLCAPANAHAQQGQVPTSPAPVIPGMNTNPNAAPPSPEMGRMAEEMAIKRNAERQKQIITDSARLLSLAQKLNAEVAKSDKNQLSVSVVKEAGEIEKLAKSIKDKMRYGE
jgi:hypothetical protein